MSLKDYQRKRDFRSTPEPMGDGPAANGKNRSGSKPVFCVQKHDASRLHYDFRLEINGALASWAVPKGPSLNPAHKRLVVHVEDHPIEYGRFEGVIPSGYGAGTVMLWDRGTWETDSADAAQALKKGKLSFTLLGEKLRGGWTLTRMHGKGGSENDNWLLIKHDDEWADAGESLLVREPKSVQSGRSLSDIARGSGTPAKRSTRRAQPGANSTKASGHTTAEHSSDPAKISGAHKGAIPKDLAPQLCTLTDAAPEGDEWVHEIKYDGYRLIAEKHGPKVRLLTRTGKDWTTKFPPLANAIAKLPAKSAVLDGEACVLDQNGHTSFQKLQKAIKGKAFDGLVFYAFDLLYLDGFVLTESTLLDRKRTLRDLFSAVDDVLIRYSDHVTGDGEQVHEHACQLALEGIIAKRADASYTPGRSRTWLKIKCSRRQEFVIIGYTPPSGSRKHFGSLLLGAYEGEGRLIYTGKVGTGFNASQLRDVKKRFDTLERKTCPANEKPTQAESRGAVWLKPEIVAEVEFTEWTDDGRLRHPAIEGLREDKPAHSARVEEPTQTNEAVKEAEKTAAVEQMKHEKKAKKPSPARGTRRTRTPSDDEASVAGVRISSPERVLFPDAGVTKLELAQYYESVADRMLPYIANRPLSTVRCPQGRAQKCFFQKHLGGTFSKPVRAIRVKEKAGSADYIAVDSVEGLVTLAQFGVIEIHPWGSREGALETPDQLTFDLDPGEGVAWKDLLTGARLVRDVLRDLELESYPKITGGTGIHVVVPIKPAVGWDEAKAFCRQVAEAIGRDDPSRYIATARRAKRAGRVFIDYLRNGRGATSVAPYSARARVGAPVAVPVRWEELGRLAGPADYTVETVGRRLARLRSDPWKNYDRAEQSLEALLAAKA